MPDVGFGASPWPFAPALAAGLWITWSLYRGAGPASHLRPFARRGLALLSAAAWLGLAWYGADPILRRDPAVYHPPAVVLAVDESPSHAALGARDQAEAALRAARRHYEALGFRVTELAFAERVVSRDAAESAGELTSFVALARALDSLQIPNLQAILLASDGRASLDGAPAAWPAPVYPLAGAPEGSGEAQGESAELDGTHPEEPRLAIRWSAARDARDVTAELRDGERVVWTQALSARSVSDWGASSEEFRLPAALGNSRPDAWTLRVRAAANPVADNDVVSLQLRGWNLPRDVLLRPLATLAERGLVDALREDSGFVVVLEPARVSAGANDVLWRRAGAPETPFAGPMIEYAAAREARDGDARAFRPGARVVWRDDGREFLPTGVVRLGDLGLRGGALELPGARAGSEPLAWVEEDGRRGWLFWREAETKRYGMALPPLWRAGFSPDATPEAKRAASRWIRGASAWARAQGRVRVVFPDPLVAGRDFVFEARFPSGESAFRDSAEHELVDAESGRLAAARGGEAVRFEGVRLAPGLRRLELRRGSRSVWTGVARSRTPREIELEKLGRDLGFLAEIASISGGDLMFISSHDSIHKISWPVLPGGQLRETRSRALSLAPLALLAAIALSLCALWALRKRLRVD